MPLIRAQLTIPTTFNNLGLASPQPLPQTYDTEGKTVQEYIDYYTRNGIGVTVLDVLSGSPSPSEQLAAYARGEGPAPSGLQFGRAGIPETNIPGSLVPIQQLSPTLRSPNAGAASAGGSFLKVAIVAAGLYFLLR